MKIAIRYYTKTGNTRKLALAIAEVIGVEAYDLSKPLDEFVDVLFWGSAVYAFSIDEEIKMFLKENADKIGQIANFSNACMVKSTYKMVKKVAEPLNIKMMEEEFYCKGRFKIFNKNRPNEDDLNNVKEFAKKIIS